MDDLLELQFCMDEPGFKSVQAALNAHLNSPRYKLAQRDRARVKGVTVEGFEATPRAVRFLLASKLVFTIRLEGIRATWTVENAHEASPLERVPPIIVDGQRFSWVSASGARVAVWDGDELLRRRIGRKVTNLDAGENSLYFYVGGLQILRFGRVKLRATGENMLHWFETD